MSRFFRTYRQKLLSMMIITGIIPLVIISYYLYTTSVSENTSYVISELTSPSKSYADSLSNSVNEKMDIVNNISHSPYLIALVKNIQNNASNDDVFLAKMQLDEKFFSDIESYNWIDDLYIIDANSGKVIFDTGMQTLQFHGLDQIDLKKSTNTVTATDIFASQVPLRNENGNYQTGVPTMFISAPIKSEVETSSILVARINVFKLILQEDKIKNYFNTEQQYLVNSQGYFLSAPSDIQKNPNFESLELHQRVNMPHSMEPTVLFNSRSTQDTVAKLDPYINYAGNSVVGAISPVKGTSWFYIVEASQDEVFQKTRQAQQTILLTITLLGITLVWISNVFTKRLIKPLNNLQFAVSEISSGRYVELENETSDEIGKIYKQFNKMSRSLKENVSVLVATERKYRTLYDNSPDLYRTVDIDGMILDCNDQYAKSLGYSKDEILGRTIFEHTAEKSLEEIHQTFSKWKNFGKVQNREIWMKRKDGSIFPALISANTIFPEDDSKGIMSNTVIKDMSELYLTRTELEMQKLKRLSDIGELAARIAHDLRNPLSVIKNTIELMKIREPIPDESKRKSYERLTRAIVRMSHQIDEVLDHVTPKPIPIQDYISLSDLVQTTLERIEIPSTTKIHVATTSLKLKCNAEKMEILFVNLILNAIQAMNNKGEIFIRSYESGKHIIIEVEDTGPGIPENLLPKIFDPLFTTRQIGTGLGLPSCKNIAEKHGGTISVKTEIGKGTAFIIRLPKNILNYSDASQAN